MKDDLHVLSAFIDPNKSCHIHRPNADNRFDLTAVGIFEILVILGS